MKKSLGIALLALVSVAAPRLATAVTTIRVSVPASTPAGSTVYIAGDFQGWNPGSPSHAMTQLPDGRWSIALSFSPGQTIQFKFTRGSWATVEKGYNGEEISNRTLQPFDNATYDFNVSTWFDLGTVTGNVESFTEPAFLGGRRCWVYLPPGYAQSSARYPVLYLQDGQNLFDIRTSGFAGEWHADEACETLIRNAEIQPIIVVGVENGPARVTEYTPWFDPDYGSGGGADAYLIAVRDVLIPEVNERYRTRTGPDHTFIGGSSLGGLLSAYAGYAYDATFGRIAAVSPSYWWNDRNMLTYAQSRPKPDLARFYQDIGTGEGAAHVTNVNDMHAIAVGQGFQSGVDLRTVIASGHQHNERDWALRFPDLLRFLVDAPVADVPPNSGAARPALAVRPNPMRSQARFEFTLPSAGVVRLDLYDVSGRHVRELANGWFEAGARSTAWDGREGTRRAPAGVYWARLSANGATTARRVVVLE